MRFFWRIGIATTLLVIASSMTAPILAVLLQKRGFSATAIGSFAMISFTTIAVLIPMMPTLFERFGILRLYRLGMAMNLACLTVYSLTDEFVIWCAAAMFGGMGGACIWNASEALLARYAPPERRGQVTGIYQTALGAALAAGPLTPALLGLSSIHALLLAVAIMAVALLVAVVPWPGTARDGPEAPNAAPRKNSHDSTPENRQTRPQDDAQRSTAAAPGPHPAMTTWAAVKLVPGLCVIAFAGGVFEAGMNAISAVHGSELGLSLAAAASIVAAIGIGSFLAQYPAGVLSDRIGTTRVFRGAALLLLLSSLLLALSGMLQPLLWASAFIWGAVGGALYTLAMIAVAHRFVGQQTAAGTAAMITGYTLGGALGPSTSGLLLDTWGITGIAIWLAVLSLAVWLAARESVSGPRPPKPGGTAHAR